MNWIKVRAYCSSANLGCGFDIMAVALNAFYDEVELRIEEPGKGYVYVDEVKGPYASKEMLLKNTAKKAIEAILSDLKINVNVAIRLWKGVPIGRGLGSSGASAAAAVKAIVMALNLNLHDSRLVEYAGIGEREAAGSMHYDNVAASLLGGLVVITSRKPLKVVKIPLKDLYFVLGIPEVTIAKAKTAFMRSVIPKTISLDLHVEASARLAALILGLMNKDRELLLKGTYDPIVEAARSKYIPCYQQVRKRAIETGALGVTISGAGPSMIALADNEKLARELAKAFKEAYEECQITSKITICKPVTGAHKI